MKHIIFWIRKNKLEASLLGLILLVGAFLRLYKIDAYMTFLGDEGRDAIVVRRLLKYGDPILIGPGTSIGNMYLGPLYYYLIAPSLFLAGYSPVGPSIFVALVGVATIAMVYFVAKEWFPSIYSERVHLGALMAAGLYAVSPTVIIFSRSSWNPNIMPFFALLCVYSIWKVWQRREYKWLLVLGVAYAFVLQSHYLGLLLAPVIGLFWLLAFIERGLGFWKYSIVGLLIFLFLMSPLVIFDSRHGWNNFGAIKTFFTQREQTVSIKPWKAIPNLWPIFEEYMIRLVAGRNEAVGRVVSAGVIFSVLGLALKRGKFLAWEGRWGFLLISVWLLVATIGLGLYKQHIYDHYYGFFFTAPYLVLGGFAAVLGDLEGGRVGRIVVLAGFFVLVVVNLLNSPLRDQPQNQLRRAQDVAGEIIRLSGGKRFNFALIAERNYEAGYRYFLDMYRANVVDIDPQNTAETITDQLFVVCEMPKEKCDPAHNAKAQVAAFGWSKIESEWEVYGVNLYRLVHNQ